MVLIHSKFFTIVCLIFMFIFSVFIIYGYGMFGAGLFQQESRFISPLWLFTPFLLLYSCFLSFKNSDSTNFKNLLSFIRVLIKFEKRKLLNNFFYWSNFLGGFLLGKYFSQGQIRLHPSFQFPRSFGSGLNVCVGRWWWVV